MFTSLGNHFCDLYLQESQLVHSTGFYVLNHDGIYSCTRIYFFKSALFITQRTFAFIVTIVKRPMPVEKSFYVALNVPHVLHVIRPAMTLKKNDVNDWTKRHMFAMAARKR